MQICILALRVDRSGGAEVYTEKFIIELARRGHEVTVVCNEALSEIEQICNVVRMQRASRGHIFGEWRFAALTQFCGVIKQLRRVPLPLPDIVIGSSPMHLFAFAQRFPHVPRIYLPHSRIAPVEIVSYQYTSWIQRNLTLWLYHYLEKWALRHSRTTVRFTDSNAELLRKYYRLSSKVRFDIIPQAVLYPSETPVLTSGPSVRLLTVGRMIESKNFGFLLHCLANMRGLSWHLDVVGDGPLRLELETLATRSGLADKIVFHGHRNDVGWFYQHADLFVFPSRLENVSLVMLEAMAHGVPTLAIKADGHRYLNSHDEVVTDGIDGLLAADEAQFAELLRNTVANPERLCKLGLSARRTVFDRHRWEVVMGHWNRLLADLTETRASVHTSASAVNFCLKSLLA